MRKRILLAFGTRPEAIKMAPVHRALLAAPEAFETLCCVTAQHRQMLDQMLATFAIVPDCDLDLMRHAQGPGDVHAAVLAAMGQVLRDTRPDILLVHGDTTTSLASALAGFYAGIAVGHVEAGLRSGDLRAPFPEEMNRRAVDMVAAYRFAPTEDSRANLLREGCDPASILVTGNTVIDSVRLLLKRIAGDPPLRAAAEASLDARFDFDWRKDRFVIVTCHRRENFGPRLETICAAIGRMATAFPDVQFVYPLHPNPAVREQARPRLAGWSNLHLVEPLPYDGFLLALNRCLIVLTDSGGLQEEAPALGKPVLVMREVTERPEAIAAGGAQLVGTDCDRIVAAVSTLLGDADAYRAMATAPNPYGDGRAADRIVAFLGTQ